MKRIYVIGILLFTLLFPPICMADINVRTGRENTRLRKEIVSTERLISIQYAKIHSLRAISRLQKIVAKQ